MNTAPLGLADHTACSQAEAAGLGGRASWFLDSLETQPLTVVMTYAGAAATIHSRTGALRAGPEHAHIPFSQEEPADTSREVGLEQDLSWFVLSRFVQLLSSVTNCTYSFIAPWSQCPGTLYSGSVQWLCY